jgi:hypothetical protein
MNEGADPKPGSLDFGRHSGCQAPLQQFPCYIHSTPPNAPSQTCAELFRCLAAIEDYEGVVRATSRMGCSGRGEVPGDETASVEVRTAILNHSRCLGCSYDPGHDRDVLPTIQVMRAKVSLEYCIARSPQTSSPWGRDDSMGLHLDSKRQAEQVHHRGSNPSKKDHLQRVFVVLMGCWLYYFVWLPCYVDSPAAPSVLPHNSTQMRQKTVVSTFQGRLTRSLLNRLFLSSLWEETGNPKM